MRSDSAVSTPSRPTAAMSSSIRVASRTAAISVIHTASADVHHRLFARVQHFARFDCDQMDAMVARVHNASLTAAKKSMSVGQNRRSLGIEQRQSVEQVFILFFCIAEPHQQFLGAGRKDVDDA